MIGSLVAGNRYTRKELWSRFHAGIPYPTGGNWLTGYVLERDTLLVFANIGTAGRTGHDFPNTFDPSSKLMTWYGKPNSHSAQPTFQRLLSGATKMAVFARWDNRNTQFTYLGSPSIKSYEDGIPLDQGGFTIKIILSFDSSSPEEPPPAEVNINGLEGQLSTVVINRYERDPELRARCIDFHGPTCKICSFDFARTYGWIGNGFCHVHHIRPLSEVAGRHEVNPMTDMIPVCANCHAMLHRRIPALTPDELRNILLSTCDKT